MKIIIDVDDEATFDESFKIYAQCVDINSEFINSVKFENAKFDKTKGRRKNG